MKINTYEGGWKSLKPSSSFDEINSWYTLIGIFSKAKSDKLGTIPISLL